MKIANQALDPMSPADSMPPADSVPPADSMSPADSVPPADSMPPADLINDDDDDEDDESTSDISDISDNEEKIEEIPPPAKKPKFGYLSQMKFLKCDIDHGHKINLCRKMLRNISNSNSHLKQGFKNGLSSEASPCPTFLPPRKFSVFLIIKFSCSSNDKVSDKVTLMFKPYQYFRMGGDASPVKIR